MNTEKIRRMTKIQKYVERDTEGQLKTARYYRSDYLGFLLLKNFFLVTIGYGLLLMLYFAVKGEEVLNNVYESSLTGLIVKVVFIYLVILAGYSALVYITASYRHQKAKKQEKYLDYQLKQLQEIDQQERGTL